ncbi:MFS general substrate transporter [Coccomyxa subellipsoidea C-169]|uniref:MFS general substrate transporter n=1 Tax=Coccomyxa subellipsoidea (strain C-169) TaxID=574566 RepID=I0YU30_COCSC|nr:MFS general substrate transporter [Coccomyxa subellipsoidea C-169]EIE21899.1 MFS general substrate transporter [Coccomyxa subellipsoidea C-169]|eukprot:XP_005646443.1 MFS general substrate transporter [Coccomyxa subellipsoidea C-169]
MGENVCGDVAVDMPDQVPADVDGNRVIRKAYWGIVPFLFLTTTLTYIDRSNVSFASLQFIPDLGLSAEQYGLGAGIFYIGYAVFQIPSNLVITRVGAPLWLGILIFGWGVVSACTSAMRTATHYYAVRFLLGVFESGVFPGSWWHLQLYFTSLEVGFAYAAVSSSTALSNVIGAPLAAGILYMDGVGGLRGWQWLFILEGCITAIYGIILKDQYTLFLPGLSASADKLHFVLAPKPSSAYFLKPAERTWLAARQDRLQAAFNSKHSRQGNWWAAIPDWKIWYLSVCYAIVQFGITAVVYFNPFIVEALFFGGNFSGKAIKIQFADQHDRAWHTAKIALFSTVLWVPVGLGMIAVSWSAKHYRERNWHSSIPALIAGVCFLVVPPTIKASPAAGYVLIIIAATGVWAPHGPMWSWPKTFLHGQGAAVGIAIFNGVGAIGGFCGPYVVGALVDRGGYVKCMQVLGCLFLVLGIAIALYRPKDLESEHVVEEGSKEEVDCDAASPRSIELTNSNESQVKTV